MKKWMVFCALVGGFTATQLSDAHAGCIFDSTVTESSIEMTPSLDCLEIEITGDSCVGDAHLSIKNQCDAPVTIQQTSPACDGEMRDYCTEPTELSANGQASSLSWRYPTDFESVTLQGIYDGETYEITVSAELTEEPYDGGCSATGADQLAPLAPLALLSVAGIVGIRRRARKDA